MDEIERRGKLQITLKMTRASFGVDCYCYTLKKPGWIHGYFEKGAGGQGRRKKVKCDKWTDRAGCTVEYTFSLFYTLP